MDILHLKELPLRLFLWLLNWLHELVHLDVAGWLVEGSVVVGGVLGRSGGLLRHF